MDQRRLKGYETKQRIDEAALRILAYEGFTGLSAKKIAEEAHISKSAVFHHYPSTDDIVAQVFDNICETLSIPIPTEGINCLEELFSTIGHATFKLEGAAQLPYLALFQYYQLALTQPVYAEKIETLKASVAAALSEAIVIIEPKVASRLNPFIDSIVIVLDAFGMHALMAHGDNRYLEQWKIQTQLFCHYLRGA